MPKPKKQKRDENSDIKINVEDKSSLAEFTKRPIPTDRELEDFENHIEEEVREEEIEDSLEEIYKEENGDMANVKKLEIKKKHGFFFWFFSVIFILAGLTGIAYGGYYLYMQSGTGSKAVELSIEGKREVVAAEEFFYTVNFKNLERVDINNIEIRLTFPENFIFLDSQPAAGIRNDTWQFANLGVHRSENIKIKGKLIGKADETAIILADMIYTPVNFSSEFKKSASFESVIKDTGIELSLISASSALVGEENGIVVKYKAKKDNYINSFQLTVEPSSEQSEEEIKNIEFGQVNEEELKAVKQELTKPGVWQVNEVVEDERDIKVRLKFIDKLTDNQEIVLRFEHLVFEGEAETVYLFYEEVINFEIIRSDLNLNLIINGSQANQAIDFSQTLNYTIAYANKGEVSMKDVVIMAVLESDFLDWASLSDSLNGRINDDTISWSKEEIPKLEELERNSEGTIDFSIDVVPLGEIDIDKDYQVKSYVQYSVGASEEPEEPDLSAQAGVTDEDMRSNTIINKINSDLNLSEQVRYFNDDNIAVGSGPQPPRVGETTSYKVYWVVSNNLHELNSLQVIVDLPHYIKWDNKIQATVGSLSYDNDSHKITWQIGRLPTSVYKADAEFNISITPEESDKNKILVVLPGTIIQAIDSETKSSINKINQAKTTKLDDDPIITDDGRVVE